MGMHGQLGYHSARCCGEAKAVFGADEQILLIYEL
jgi:hypothetical protein